MTSNNTEKGKKLAEYYDHREILDEIIDEPVEWSMDTHLRKEILDGHRGKRLKRISITMDPFYLQAIRKIATMKSIPYQNLIRHWLSVGIRKEMHLEEES